jgi:hypothetical protein
MAQQLGWRSFWWLNTALLGFVGICCIFLFPETKFQRAFVPADSTLTPSPLKLRSSEHVEGTSVQNGILSSMPAETELEKAPPVPPQKPTPKSEGSETLTHIHTHQDPWLGRGKPSKAQWRLWQPYEGNFFLELWMPWQLLAFPIVEFSSFVVSWTASCFLTLNLTQAQVFAAPPYNFTSTKIGFFNFAILIGASIGLFTAGPLSDSIAARLTKRNRGVREPEMRLLAMVPYVILMVLGNLIVAIGYERSWDWKVCCNTRTYLLGNKEQSKLILYRLSLSSAIPARAYKSRPCHPSPPHTPSILTSRSQDLSLSLLLSTRMSGDTGSRNSLHRGLFRRAISHLL